MLKCNKQNAVKSNKKSERRTIYFEVKKNFNQSRLHFFVHCVSNIHTKNFFQNKIFIGLLKAQMPRSFVVAAHVLAL